MRIQKYAKSCCHQTTGAIILMTPCNPLTGSLWCACVYIVSRGHTPFRKRDLVAFAVAACCTGISFTRVALAIRPHNYLEKTAEAAACGFTVDLHLVISY